VATLISGFFWKGWCFRRGLVDEPGPRKIHYEPIPLAGGLALITGLLVPIALGSFVLFYYVGNSSLLLDNQSGTSAVGLLQYGLSRRAVELAAILAGGIGILIVGFWDDLHELRPRTKFFGQLCVAILVAASGVRITLFVHYVWFHYLITVVWIITLINAFNFMDNMNGLCAGLAAIASFYFGLIAAAEGQYLVGLIAFLTFGALLGFLPANFPRARMFLGDAGSHLLGYMMAVLAILPHFYTQRHPRPWAVIIPLLVLALPLGDLVWVVFLRTRMGKPFYEGDTNHLSHRLVRAGLSPVRAVFLIWLSSVVTGAVALLVR
jgi:UDP-GlcNAc:undecaprenyl-phosphate GlcNAc-1-phosphate transferase